MLDGGCWVVDVGSIVFFDTVENFALTKLFSNPMRMSSQLAARNLNARNLESKPIRSPTAADTTVFARQRKLTPPFSH